MNTKLIILLLAKIYIVICFCFKLYRQGIFKHGTEKVNINQNISDHSSYLCNIAQFACVIFKQMNDLN